VLNATLGIGFEAMHVAGNVPRARNVQLLSQPMGGTMGTKLAASLVATLAVTMIGAGGLAARASSGATIRGSASPMHGGAVHLRLMSTKATSRRISVIATGAFTAGGTDRPGRVTDLLSFQDGTLRYRHVTSTFSASFGSQTCLLTETLTGRFTLADGTGRYAGVHGSGHFALSIVAVTRKNRAGRCTHVQAPATFQQLATANGTVTG
jgi:hypothetical protein